MPYFCSVLENNAQFNHKHENSHDRAEKNEKEEEARTVVTFLS